MMSLFYRVLLCLFLFTPSLCAKEKPLVVYVHESIYILQQDLLTQQCDFPLILKSFSGADLLAKALLEKGNGRADVIVGLEGEQALQQRILDIAVDLPKDLLSKISLPFSWECKRFIPLSYAYLTFLYNREKVMPDLDNLEDFLKTLPDKSIVIPDPRTSMVGRGALAWIPAQDDGLLHKKVLTYPKGWSGSVAILNGGKAAVMLGYTTSALFHRKNGQTSIDAALFKGTPHPVQVMTAFLLKKKKIHPKAEVFLRVLLSKEVQKTAFEQYSYPVIEVDIPREFEDLRPPKAFVLEEFTDERLQSWMRAGYAQ